MLRWETVCFNTAALQGVSASGAGRLLGSPGEQPVPQLLPRAADRALLAEVLGSGARTAPCHNALCPPGGCSLLCRGPQCTPRVSLEKAASGPITPL